MVPGAVDGVIGYEGESATPGSEPPFYNLGRRRTRGTAQRRVAINQEGARGSRPAGSFGFCLRALCQGFFFTVFVAEINPLAEARGYQHQYVSRHKHPVAEQPAIHDKAARSRKLSDEKPPRQALCAAFAPLRIDLAANCGQKNGGGTPADQLSAHVRRERGRGSSRAFREWAGSFTSKSNLVSHLIAALPARIAIADLLSTLLTLFGRRVRRINIRRDI